MTIDKQKELRELKKKRALLAEKMVKLVEKAEQEERAFTDEERTEWDGMRKEIDQFDQRIDLLKEAETLERSLDEPLNALPPETREYERDALGNLLKPKKKGSADQRQEQEQQYTDAFMTLLRSDQPGMLELNEEQRKIMRAHVVHETRAQGTVPNSSGGFLIPTTLASRIIEVMKAYGGLRQFATVMNTTAGETINFPTNDDTGNEGELVAEHEKVDETELEFGQKSLGAYKYSSKVVRVSIELLQDSAFALDSFITRKFGQRLGRITARHYATGTGSEQPTGLITAADVGYTSTSSTTIGYVDLLRLKHSVDPAYRNMGDCRWLFNDSTLLMLKEMLDDNGRPLWKPSIADGTPDLIDSDPYVVDQGVAKAGAGAVPMAYGDLSEYVIRDVMGFQLHRMVEKYIDYGQIGFLAFLRSDANLMDSEAVKTLKMSGTEPEPDKANTSKTDKSSK